MDVRIIENEQQYQEYLARIDELFEAPEGSEEAKELDLLALLVNKYEEENYPLSVPDPIEFIKIRMEDLGLKDKDLVPYIGDKAVVSKILNRRRKLSIDMIRSLHSGLGFPLDVLVQDYGIIGESVPGAGRDIAYAAQIGTVARQVKHKSAS